MRDSLDWLAGLLEGEGTFFMIQSRKSGRLYRYPHIAVAMTDRDVVARAAVIFDGNKVHCAPPSQVDGKKAQRVKGNLLYYRACISGEKAAVLMRKLLPLMGKRRSAKIHEILSEWDARVPANTRRQMWGRDAAAKRMRTATGTFLPNVAEKPNLDEGG